MGGDADQRCAACRHYRVFRTTPGGQVEGGYCLRDGEDTGPDDWCEVWAAQEAGDDH